MTGTTPQGRLPGTWLEAIARAVFDEPALSHAALPTIADFQQEWTDAGGDRRRRWVARWRGYIAFWSLVVMAPIVFRTAAVPIRAPWSRARRLGMAAIALIVVGTMLHEVVRAWLLNHVPGGTWRIVGLITPVAFLAGPVAVALLLRRGRTAGGWVPSVHVFAVMLLSCLSVTVAGLSSGAGVVGFFHGISERGSPGFGPLVAITSDAGLAMRNGLLMAVGCLIVAGAIGGRARRTDDSVVPSSRMSASLAMGLAGILIAMLLGVDQLLRAHHDVMGMLTLLAAPGSIRQSGLTVPLAADSFEDGMSLLLILGFALTTVAPVAGIASLRVARGRAPHRLFIWVSRAAVIAAVAGGAYHARVVIADLASFHETVDRLRANTHGPGT